MRADQHDLRTPLNSLLFTLVGVRMLGALNEDQLTALALAEKTVLNVSTLLDQMLDIGNIDARGVAALNRRAALPLEMIGLAVAQVATLASEKGQVLTSSTEPLPALRVDGEKIVRVLVNLLANAIKFTPEGGAISVGATNYVDEAGAAVLFSVRDNGIGLSEESLGRLFTEGFRVDADAPTHRSTGIGLTFCKRIVEAHGGKIWAESKPGNGAAFHFSLSRTTNLARTDEGHATRLGNEGQKTQAASNS